MDRVHRIGQTRPVKIVRYCVERSVEERILDLQESKRLLGTGALTKLSAEEARKTRVSDLSHLFS